MFTNIHSWRFPNLIHKRRRDASRLLTIVIFDFRLSSFVLIPMLGNNDTPIMLVSGAGIVGITNSYIRTCAVPI